MRDPVDRVCDFIDAHAGAEIVTEAEHDLGFDARLWQLRYRNPVIRAHIHHRGVVDIAPDRLEYAVLIPDGPVGETDLATDRLFAARHPQRARSAVTA